MKLPTNYANRGSALEELVKVQNIKYRASGVAVIHKIPTEILPVKAEFGKGFSGAIIKGNQDTAVDFLGRVGNVPVAFDTKEFNDKRIAFSRVTEGQARFFDDFTKGGQGIGFVLVGWKLQRFWVIPWTLWKYGPGIFGTNTLSLLQLDKKSDCEIHQSNNGKVNIDYVPVLAKTWGIVLQGSEKEDGLQRHCNGRGDTEAGI
jgi:recombination protein U